MKLTALGVLQLFRSGYDTDEIAKQFGVSEAEIYNVLAERLLWPGQVRKSFMKAFGPSMRSIAPR